MLWLRSQQTTFLAAFYFTWPFYYFFLQGSLQLYKCLEYRPVCSWAVADLGLLIGGFCKKKLFFSHVIIIKCTNATGQKDKRGGIQFSGYHPLKDVKFVVDEATGRHFLSKVQWPGDETDVSWWRMWNVSWLLSRRWHFRWHLWCWLFLRLDLLVFLPQWEWSLHLWSGRPVDGWWACAVLQLLGRVQGRTQLHEWGFAGAVKLHGRPSSANRSAQRGIFLRHAPFIII